MAKRKRRTSSSGGPRNVVAEARAGGRGAGGGRGTRWAWEQFKSIAGAVVIFLVVTTLFVQAYRIPSPSMVPALLPGDWLFVNKLRYGPHIPFTRINLPGYAQPVRYDIVVFESPYQVDQPWDPTPTLVKRVIGMPGDTIHSRVGLVHINGLPQRQGYGASSTPGDPNGTSPLFEWHSRIAVRGTRFGEPPARPTVDHWGPLVIPPKHFFMMGDNRYESKDSRFWGIVPRENIRGRPLFVYYSYEPDCDRAICPATAIRWRRIGSWIR